MNVGTLDWMTALSLGLGAFVVLAGLATLVGMPWRYTSGGVGLAVARAGGALLAVAFGVGLARIALGDRVG